MAGGVPGASCPERQSFLMLKTNARESQPADDRLRTRRADVSEPMAASSPSAPCTHRPSWIV